MNFLLQSVQMEVSATQTRSKLMEQTVLPTDAKTSDKISLVLQTIDKLLQIKNKRYGDSMQKPVKVFVKDADNLTNDIALRKRLDEKLARIANADELRKNDTADLIGYLVLLCIEKNWLNFEDLID